MAHLSILGTGTMGQAIAAVAGKGGHTLQLLGADDVAIVVDITNPLNFETFDSLVVPADSSAAEIAAALPRSRVLKAFPAGRITP